MGVKISALKVKKFVGKDISEELWDVGVKRIYTLDFRPLVHLSQFQEGFYETEILEVPDLSITCSTYNIFREKVCLMVHNVDTEEIWKNIEEWVDAPFVEFIDFADNEGSFDFVVAEKLYKDFSNYQQKAEKELREYLEYYNCYREILRVVAENKGVIYYS